jgi:hypothetical protein
LFMFAIARYITQWSTSTAFALPSIEEVKTCTYRSGKEIVSSTNLTANGTVPMVESAQKTFAVVCAQDFRHGVTVFHYPYRQCSVVVFGHEGQAKSAQNCLDSVCTSSSPSSCSIHSKTRVQSRSSAANLRCSKTERRAPSVLDRKSASSVPT